MVTSKSSIPRSSHGRLPALPFSGGTTAAGGGSTKAFAPAGGAPRKLDAQGISSFGAARRAQASRGQNELGPASAEQLCALHERLLLDPDLPRAPRIVSPGVLAGAGMPALDERLDLHPIYGASLKRWLEQNTPEPGQAAMGLFRGVLHDLGDVLSGKTSKFGSVVPHVG